MHTQTIFSLAALPATLWALAFVLRRRPVDGPVSRGLGARLLLAYGCGLFAVIPALLRRAGLPDAFCDGPWMAVFFGYPLWRNLRSGGMFIGSAAGAALWLTHYATVLLAIRRATRLWSSASINIERPGEVA